MRNSSLRMRLSSTAVLAKPPTEFRIFAGGKIRTTKGAYLFDRKAARSVVENWKDYGNRLVIDYEHKSVDENARAGDGKAAGWFDLQLRGDELWAVNVRWTPKAAKEISEFEWAYFSPTFDYDEDSGRILELVNVAITNVPATKDLNQLVAASRQKRGGRVARRLNSKRKHMTNKVTLTREESAIAERLATTSLRGPTFTSDVQMRRDFAKAARRARAGKTLDDGEVEMKNVHAKKLAEEIAAKCGVSASHVHASIMAHDPNDDDGEDEAAEDELDDTEEVGRAR